MKSLLLKVVAISLLTLTAHSQKLAPGNMFPQLTLPLVETGEPTSFHSLTGKKMMLHIFASW